MQQFPIIPPIIVSERGDPDIFEFVADAERYLEPYDIDILVAYDSEGRLLRLLPTEPRITIESTELTPSHAQALRMVLLKFLKNVRHEDSALQSKSTVELIAISLQYKTK